MTPKLLPGAIADLERGREFMTFRSRESATILSRELLQTLNPSGFTAEFTE